MPWREYYVYMVTSHELTVLYTGVTRSLERRMWEHKHGTHDGFTKMYHCDRLVYFETYSDIRQAIAREKELKGWTRAKKEALVNSVNRAWADLSVDWYREGPSSSVAAQGAALATQDDRNGRGVSSSLAASSQGLKSGKKTSK
jgi:putative endonuclease